MRAGDVVVDLGAGEGALTESLARIGARVLAVELHAHRADVLRQRFADTRVAVVEVEVAAFRWPGHPFRVVSNPPYDGVNALVRRLLATRHLRSADLVVAERAARGLAQRHPARVTLGLRVPRHAFLHRPPYDARVVRIR